MSELLLSHLLVTDGDGHAGDFLELELNGSSDIINFSLEGLGVRHNLREHTNPVEDGSEDGGDLLNIGV